MRSSWSSAQAWVRIGSKGLSFWHPEAFSQAYAWQQSDVERLFWLSERFGLDPLERDVVAIAQPEPFPPRELALVFETGR